MSLAYWESVGISLLRHLRLSFYWKPPFPQKALLVHLFNWFLLCLLYSLLRWWESDALEMTGFLLPQKPHLCASKLFLCRWALSRRRDIYLLWFRIFLSVNLLSPLRTTLFLRILPPSLSNPFSLSIYSQYFRVFSLPHESYLLSATSPWPPPEPLQYGNPPSGKVLTCSPVLTVSHLLHGSPTASLCPPVSHFLTPS